MCDDDSIEFTFCDSIKQRNQKLGIIYTQKNCVCVCVCDFPNFSWKQDFFAVSRDIERERDSDLKLWKWVQNFERKKGGFGVQWWLMRFNHLCAEVARRVWPNLLTQERLWQRKSLRKNIQERASKQARSRKLLIDKGVHGRNYCCGATTTTTTTTHSLLGKWPTLFFFFFFFLILKNPWHPTKRRS